MAVQAATGPEARTPWRLPRDLAWLEDVAMLEGESDHVPRLSVQSEWDQRVATVTVRGNLDAATVDILSGCLGSVLDREPARIIVDVAGLEYVSSAGVRAIVNARQALPEECAVILRSPNRLVRQVFELTGLDSLCVIA